MRRIAHGLLLSCCGLLLSGCHVHLHYHAQERVPDALTQSLEEMTNDRPPAEHKDDLGWPDLDR